jgi:hypothetical protein
MAWRRVRLRRELSRTVDTLDEGGVEPAGEVEGFQAGFQLLEPSPLHTVLDADDAPLAIGLLHLAIEQTGRHDPLERAFAQTFTPGAEVGGEGVEVGVEAITGEQAGSRRPRRVSGGGSGYARGTGWTPATSTLRSWMEWG